MSKGGRYVRKAAAPTKGVKAMLIAVCVLAVLVVGVGTAAGLYLNSILNGVNHVEVEQIQYTQPAAPQSVEAEAAPAAETEAAGTEAAAEPAKETVVSNPRDYQNFLIVSKPVRKGGSVKQTETMILCTLNKRTKELTLTSLLADTLVEAPAYKQYAGGEATLGSIYGMGATSGGTAGSMAFMNQTLYNNFGIEVDKNFELDLQVLARIVTRLQDVKIKLTDAEAKYLSEATGDEIQAGEQKMDGALAKVYIQMWSDDEAEGVDALTGQKKLLESILLKVRSQYVDDLENIVRDIMPSITTSMTWVEFREFLLTMLPMVRNLSVENGGTCPVEYTEAQVDVNGDGTEETVLTFDAAQTTKAMRKLTKGEA